MESLVVVAHLKPDAYEEACALIKQGPPFDLENSGLTRNAVFCSPREVIFLFEGPDAEATVERMLNDPVVSARFSVWGHLIDGAPVRAVREFEWHAADAVG